jgi:hypothetical protein
MIPLQFLDSPKNLIAICDGKGNNPIFVGCFNPILLRNWAQHIVDNFGEDTVFLYSSKGSLDGKPVRALTAAIGPDDALFIAVPGITREVE